MLRYPSVTPDHHLQAIKEHLKRSHQYSGKTVPEIREAAEASAGQIPAVAGTLVEQVQAEQINGEWIRAGDCAVDYVKTKEPAAPDKLQVILYCHGGGFVSGSCAVYRDLAARISSASGTAVLTVEYRLAPEHSYPAANEDCLAAYQWLLEQGVLPANIMLGGDSVGATLALMTLLTLRDHAVELPAGAFLLSPHADLVHLDGESYESRAESDPTGSREANQRILEDYLGDYTGDMPGVLSPLQTDLSGLPPLFMQAGDLEVLLSDAERLAAKAKAAGNKVTLEVWENMWCAFQLLAALLPEAQQAIGNIGGFIREALNPGSGLEEQAQQHQ